MIFYFLLRKALKNKATPESVFCGFRCCLCVNISSSAATAKKTASEPYK
jgi:hypothetical protein